jgi:hypothetical protein
MKVVALGKVKYKGEYYHEKVIFEHDSPEKAIEMGLIAAYETEDNRTGTTEEEVAEPQKANRKRGRQVARN